jgi:NAD(P)-dependent dehydrogenase (short-subunit alcohol dehydrogenase family)
MRNSQHPLHTGYSAATIASEVLEGRDLSGLQAIVTGGYSGIGVETVRALRNAGANVLVPARDLDKASRTLHGIDVQVVKMDLTDPASIDAFATEFLARNQPLDILINSAGIMASPLARDARGYEQQFATNHLGHFQLTARLWPALVNAGSARVVSVSSRGHFFSDVDFEDPNFERRDYDRWIAYGQSKTANVMFAVGLDARGAAHGVRAFALHPGAIVTELSRHMSAKELAAAGAFDADGKPVADLARGLKSVEQGAATSVWAATSAQLNDLGGLYLEDCDVAVITPDPEPGVEPERVGVRGYAIDPVKAERLWALSEQLTGVSLPV